MTGADPEKHRLLFRAAFKGERTARMEAASRRNQRRVWHLAPQWPARAAVSRIRRRHGGEEGSRVWVLGFMHDLLCGSLLDNPAEVHHSDPIGDHAGEG